jgi:hypothetical protein
VWRSNNDRLPLGHRSPLDHARDTPHEPMRTTLPFMPLSVSSLAAQKYLTSDVKAVQLDDNFGCC